ncbi:MAG: DUF4870 domain-containing protein [Armatimonadota bacterium]
MDSPTQDEKLMAGLAHLAIILPYWGIIGAIVVWATQKDKSKFVRAHAVQAVGWQVFEIILSLALGIVCGGGFFVMMMVLAVAGGGQPEAAPLGMLIPFAVMGAMGLVMLVVIIVGVVAACNALQGNPYSYPLIGHYVERFHQ